jgi:hypothetical protein
VPPLMREFIGETLACEYHSIRAKYHQLLPPQR